jgi:hypothetical protein
VVTRPSIPRVAAGVFLGLLLFTVTALGVTLVAAEVWLDVLAERLEPGGTGL